MNSIFDSANKLSTMKRILLTIICFTAVMAASAQENALAPDQNPNYKVSQDKYTAQKETLMANMNTTVQDTYKAYDWYIAKQERRQQRIDDRRERRLYRLQNYGNYYNPYNQMYDPYGDFYRYSPNRFRYRGWRHGW